MRNVFQRTGVQSRGRRSAPPAVIVTSSGASQARHCAVADRAVERDRRVEAHGAVACAQDADRREAKPGVACAIIGQHQPPGEAAIGPRRDSESRFGQSPAARLQIAVEGPVAFGQV